MECKTNFSNVLKRYKEEHGLSYVEFAEDLGIAKSALENYINELQIHGWIPWKLLRKN